MRTHTRKYRDLELVRLLGEAFQQKRTLVLDREVLEPISYKVQGDGVIFELRVHQNIETIGRPTHTSLK